VDFVGAGDCTISAFYAGLTGDASVSVSAPDSLIPDDANTLVNLFIQDGALKDTKNNGGADWVEHGSPTYVGSASLGWTSGKSAEGVKCPTLSDYFQLGAGNWAAAPASPIWVTMVLKSPDPDFGGWMSNRADTGNYHPGFRLKKDTYYSSVDGQGYLYPLAFGDFGSVAASVVVVSVFFPAGGADNRIKVSYGSVGLATSGGSCTAATGAPLIFGKDAAGNLACGANTVLYAMRITTTAPSDADILALHTALLG
jgi:hypothetical protein